MQFHGLAKEADRSVVAGGPVEWKTLLPRAATVGGAAGRGRLHWRGRYSPPGTGRGGSSNGLVGVHEVEGAIHVGIPEFRPNVPVYIHVIGVAIGERQEARDQRVALQETATAGLGRYCSRGRLVIAACEVR